MGLYLYTYHGILAGEKLCRGVKEMTEVMLSLATIERMAGDIQNAIRHARVLFEKSDFTVDKKADGSPVTSIDTTIEVLLKNICRTHLGESIHFVAEEVEDLASSEGKRFWVFIDPIDGTTPLCAGDAQNSCIAVGVFLDGAPYVGFVAKLGDQSIMYGGHAIDGIVRRLVDGQSWEPIEVGSQNKMCCIDLASGPAADPVMSKFILSVVADRTLGGYPYNVPSIAAALKLIEGHSKFFIGSNSKPWDVGAIMPMLEWLGYTFQSLETGLPITLDGSRTAIPAFVMSISPEYTKRLIALYRIIKESV